MGKGRVMDFSSISLPPMLSPPSTLTTQLLSPSAVGTGEADSEEGGGSQDGLHPELAPHALGLAGHSG